MPDNDPLAFSLQTETEHGTCRLVARVVLVTGEGLRNPLWQWGADPRKAFADFAVHAYIDRDNEHAWCPRYSFTAHQVELDQAESMVRLLRKIHKGLDVAEQDAGHLRADDFAGYLFRIAAILHIRTYYVRNTDKARAMSGEIFRRTDATGVQCWVAERERELGKPRPDSDS